MTHSSRWPSRPPWGKMSGVAASRIGQSLRAARTRAGWTREALDDRSRSVEFADSADWYPSPLAALNRYRAFVQEKYEAGAPWVRIVGEPVWTGRSDAEITTWIRYESLLNLALASSPATIV